MSQTLLERCSFLAASAAGNPTHYMVEQALAQAELDWRFLTFEVDEAHLQQALTGLDVLGFRGVLVAPEFRTAAVPLADSLSRRAERAGALTCLVRKDGKLQGENTQGTAFVEAVGGETGLAGQSVMVIGAGRVARTIATAVAEAQASRIYLTDRDEAALAVLEESLREESEATVEAEAIAAKIVQVPEGIGVLVFAPDSDDLAARPPIDTSQAVGNMTVVDTRLRASRTGLVKFASEQGATIIDGVDLFARETAIALELWTGLTFDRAPLVESAEEFLGL